MQFIKTFQLYDFFDTLVSLFVAFVFGTLIGAERQYRQRSAGLRTNVLVCVGAAAGPAPRSALTLSPIASASTAR